MLRRTICLPVGSSLFPKLRSLRRPFQLAVGSYWFFRVLGAPCARYDKDLELVKRAADDSLLENRNMSVMQKLYKSIATLLRFLQLVAIFSPSVLLLPLCLFEKTQDIWFTLFVRTIEWAGVVWIKSFQYLSHRRDIIGEKMAMRFMHLREQAPGHSLEDTVRSIRDEFGKNIDDIFEKFDPRPIASGSISQIYEAQYKGERVAVKVRHPNIGPNIARDIDILFGVSGLLSYLWSGFEFPITKSALKKTLTNQLDFTIEVQNLKTFNELFVFHKDVHFPVPFEEVSVPSVLVETFIDGKPITYYERHRHQLNKTIARIGGMTFFEMFMKYNFIHADCHGGNILVRIIDKPFTRADRALDLLYRGFRWLENILVRLSGESQVAKELYLESRREEDESREMQQRLGLKVEVILIDVGLVIELEKTDRKHFANFIRCIIEKEPEECAKMVYSLSLHRNEPIVSDKGIKYQEYYDKLRAFFQHLTSIDLRHLQGLYLLKGMCEIVREYGMKLNGELGTLITNMLILEQIAKDLYPDMNVLSCAVPYFYIPQL